MSVTKQDLHHAQKQLAEARAEIERLKARPVPTPKVIETIKRVPVEVVKEVEVIKRVPVEVEKVVEKSIFRPCREQAAEIAALRAEVDRLARELAAK